MGQKGVKDGCAQTLRVSKGLRLGGAGAKPKFADLYPAIKHFFEHERSSGNYVDQEDLVNEFQHLVRLSLVRLQANRERRG